MSESVNNNGAGRLEGDSAISSKIPPTDEANAEPRPDNIDKFYVEDEAEEVKQEQRKAYGAKGEEEAAKPKAEAAKLEHQATKAEEASDRLADRATKGGERLEAEEAVLEKHTRRAPGDKLVYWLVRALILGGDIAGIGGAGLLLGEEPIYAFLQAIAAAVSAITLGGIGREVCHLLAASARQKAPDKLTDEEKLFAGWFAGPSRAEAYVKIVALLCTTGIALVACGIFSLRAVTEGMGPAIAFGAFALALGLASFYNSFAYGDEVADHLDSQRSVQRKREKEAAKAAAHPVIGRYNRAKAETTSIIETYRRKGEAVAHTIGRYLYHVLNACPGVAGNGTAPKHRGSSTNGRRAK